MTITNSDCKKSKKKERKKIRNLIRKMSKVTKCLTPFGAMSSTNSSEDNSAVWKNYSLKEKKKWCEKSKLEEEKCWSLIQNYIQEIDEIKDSISVQWEKTNQTSTPNNKEMADPVAWYTIQQLDTIEVVDEKWFHRQSNEKYKLLSAENKKRFSKMAQRAVSADSIFPSAKADVDSQIWFFLDKFQTCITSAKFEDAAKMIVSTEETLLVSLIDSIHGFSAAAEELGDMMYVNDPGLGFEIYIKLKIHRKVVRVLLAKGYYDQIFIYATKVKFNVDYLSLLRFLLLKLKDYDKSINFSLSLVKYSKELMLCNIRAFVDEFANIELNEACSTLLNTAKDKFDVCDSSTISELFEQMHSRVEMKKAPKTVLNVFEDLFSK